MKTKTKIKGGRIAINHNTVVCLKTKTKIKGGRISVNHNNAVR